MELKGLSSPGCCVLCGKPLRPKKIEWLECDQRDGSFHIPGSVPEEFSQGVFEFGSTCAKKIVNKSRA